MISVFYQPLFSWEDYDYKWGLLTQFRIEEGSCEATKGPQYLSYGKVPKFYMNVFYRQLLFLETQPLSSLNDYTY